MVEHIGRWSMLDVFVVTLTVALVRFKSLAVITAGPGAIAFGSVVILTMLASMQYDPRLIWDPVDGTQGPSGNGTQGSDGTRGTQGTHGTQGSTQQSQDLKHD
jgi:paraquat-inducible protein A